MLEEHAEPLMCCPPVLLRFVHLLLLCRLDTVTTNMLLAHELMSCACHMAVCWFLTKGWTAQS